MKTELFGIQIDNLTLPETIGRIDSFITSRIPHQHVVINVNKVIKAYKDADFRRTLNSCALINAEGQPVIWASAVLGKKIKERITGIDLFFEILRQAPAKGWKVFFLGAEEPVLQKTIERVRHDYPQVSIAGYRNGYWKNGEEREIVEQIHATRPDILFVAITSPKKEFFLSRNLDRLGVPFVMGVGGTFDVMAGKFKRAPVWMQRHGLEWFYRFLQDPRRLFGRYFLEGSAFFSILLQELRRTPHRRTPEHAS